MTTTTISKQPDISWFHDRFDDRRFENPALWNCEANWAWKSGEVWPPLSAQMQNWSEEVHKLFVADFPRMQKYRTAIRLVLKAIYQNNNKREPRILDLGTGCGILAVMVLQEANDLFTNELRDISSAPRPLVYAVEQDNGAYKLANVILSSYKLNESPILWNKSSEDYAAKANPEGAILLIHSSSYDLLEWLKKNSTNSRLDLFDPQLAKAKCLRRLKAKAQVLPLFDLIVSETIGGIGDDEDCVAILDHAIHCFLSRTRRRRGRVIPRLLDSRFAPILEEPDLNARAADPTSSHPLSVSQTSLWNQVAKHLYKHSSTGMPNIDQRFPFARMYDVVVPPDKVPLLSHLVRSWVFGWESDYFARQSDYVGKATWPEAKDKAYLVGFQGFFRAVLADEPNVDTQAPGCSFSLGRVEINTGADGRRTSIDNHTKESMFKPSACDCWKQRLLPLPRPILLRAKDRIEFQLTRRTAANDEREVNQKHGSTTVTYSWQATVVAPDGTGATTGTAVPFEMRFPFPQRSSHRPPFANFVRLCEIVFGFVLALLASEFLGPALLDNHGPVDLNDELQLNIWLRLLMGLGIVVWILRLLASFFILMEDADYHELMDSTSRKLMPFMQLMGEFLTTGSAVFAILVLNHKTWPQRLFLFDFAIVGILLFPVIWDLWACRMLGQFLKFAVYAQAVQGGDQGKSRLENFSIGKKYLPKAWLLGCRSPRVQEQLLEIQRLTPAVLQRHLTLYATFRLWITQDIVASVVGFLILFLNNEYPTQAQRWHGLLLIVICAISSWDYYCNLKFFRHPRLIRASRDRR